MDSSSLSWDQEGPPCQAGDSESLFSRAKTLKNIKISPQAKILTIDEQVDISDIGDMFSKNCFSFKHERGCCWPN